MDKAIWLFSYSLMEKYLNDMISAGKFDATALDNVDYKKARGILDNLKHIKDSTAKISCIKQAFLACPYNIDVYLSAVTTGAFDSDTYNTATYFGVNDDLVIQIKQKLVITKESKLRDTVKHNEQYIDAYALCVNRDRISVLKELTASLYTTVIQQYNDLRHATDVSVIAKNVKGKSDSDVKYYVENRIKSIIADDDFSVLINECGYTDLLATISPNGPVEKFSNKSEIDSYYTDSIVLKCSNYNKDTIYAKSLGLSKSDEILDVEKARIGFLSIIEWKDSADKIAHCEQRISQLKEEQEKLLAATAKKAKKVKIISAIAAAVVVIASVFAVICVNVIIPNTKYNNAMSLFESGKYDEAYSAFKELGDYSNASEMLPEVRYQKACSYLEQQKFEEAIDIFVSLKDYNSSSEKVTESKYQYALWLLDNEDYDKALTIFSFIDGYSDVDEQIKLCQYNQALEYIENNDFEDAFEIYNVISNYNELEERLFSSCYDYAQKLYDKNEYISAHNHFKMIENYRDSAEKMKELSTKDHIIQAMYAEVGDIIEFGTYEQDGNADNGAEPIEWIVIDEVDDKKLVVSKLCLIKYKYGEKKYDCNWSQSGARLHLNAWFFNNVFSECEREYIVPNSVNDTEIKEVHYRNDFTNVDIVVTDNVFILTTNQARKIPDQYYIPECANSINTNNMLGFIFFDNHESVADRVEDIKVKYINMEGEVKITSAEGMFGLRPAIWISNAK